MLRLFFALFKTFKLKQKEKQTNKNSGSLEN